MLFRPLFFDKLVAWGGEATIRSAKEYIGPGFELVAFDAFPSWVLLARDLVLVALVVVLTAPVRESPRS